MTAVRDPFSALRSLRLFADSPDALLGDIARMIRYRSGKRGTVILRQDDTDRDLYGVLRGHLEVFTPTLDGRELMLNILRPGDVFGEVSLIDGRPRSATVVALSDFEVVTIARAPFLDALRREPELAARLLQIMAERLRSLSERSEDRASLGLPGRLAKLLLVLFDAAGTVVERDRLMLPFPLPQRSLGDMVDGSRESVNRCLQRWMQDGIVERAGPLLTLLDRARLEALAHEAAPRE